VELEQRGFALNFRSSHLVARNWIQIALLGDPPRAGLERMLNVLRLALFRRVSPLETSVRKGLTCRV
jgi:hypothetical protein